MRTGRTVLGHGLRAGVGFDWDRQVEAEVADAVIVRRMCANVSYENTVDSRCLRVRDPEEIVCGALGGAYEYPLIKLDGG